MHSSSADARWKSPPDPASEDYFSKIREITRPLINQIAQLETRAPLSLSDDPSNPASAAHHLAVEYGIQSATQTALVSFLDQFMLKEYLVDVTELQKALEQSKQDLVADREVVRAKIKELKETRAKYEKKVASSLTNAKGQLNRALAEKARCDSRDAEQDRREKALAADKAKLDSIHAQHVQARSKMKDHGILLTAREKAISDAEVETASRRDAVVRRESKVKKREEKHAKTEALCQKYNAENVDLFDQVSRLQRVLGVVGTALLPACNEEPLEWSRIDQQAVRSLAVTIENTWGGFTSEIERSMDTIEEQKQQIQLQTSQIHAHEAQIRDQATQIRDQATKIHDQGNQITEYEDRTQSFISQLEDIDCTIQDQNRQIVGKNDQILAQTAENESLCSQIREHKAQKVKLSEKISRLDADLAAITRELTEQGRRMSQEQDNVVHKYNSLVARYRSGEEDRQGLEETNKQLQAQSHQLSSDHQRLKSELRELSSDHQRLKSELRELSSDHQRLKSEHDKLRSENKHLQTELSSQLQQLSKRSAAGSEYQALRVSNSQLQARNEKLRTEYQQLSSDHRKVSSEHEKLQSDHQLLSSEHQRVQTELEQLRSGLEHPVQPIGGAGDSISGQGIPNISIAPPQTSELVRAQLGAVQVDRSRLLELEEQNKALQSQVDHLRAELYKHQSRTPIERHKRDDVPLDGPTESSLQLEGQIQELLKDKQQLKRLLSRSEDAYRRCNEELSQTKMSFATLRDKIKLRDSTYCHVKSTPLLKLLRDLQAVIKMEGAKGSAPGSATLQYLSAAPAHKPSFDELINTLCHQMPILHDMSSMHSLCLGAWSSLAPALGLFPTDHFTVLVKKLQIRDGMELMTSRLRHSLTYGLTKTPSHGRSQASTPTTPSQYSPTKPTSVARKTKVRPTSRAQGHSYIQRTGSSQTKQVKPLWNGSVRK